MVTSPAASRCVLVAAFHTAVLAAARLTLQPRPDTFESQAPGQKWSNDLWAAERIYGPGVAMRMQLERAHLMQFRRPATLPSSFIAIDGALGRDVTIGFEDLYDRSDAVDAPEGMDLRVTTVHEIMERDVEGGQ